MSIAIPPSPSARRRPVSEGWLNRRRWSRVGWTYLFLLILSLVFLGPFLMGVISSFKDNANEYPPRLIVPQLTPRYISTAANLGSQGGGGAWAGGLTPGASVNFNFVIRYPNGAPDTPPQVNVPPRRPGGGLGAVRPTALASEYVKTSAPQVVSRDGQDVTYRVTVTYPPLTAKTGDLVTATLPAQTGADFLATVNGQNVKVNLDTPQAQQVQYTLGPDLGQAVQLVRADGQYYLRGPLIARTPLDINIERGQQFVSADLPPADVQNFGRSQSVRNITPGVMGYTFNNYQRAFVENQDPQSGQYLLLRWIFNSFLIALAKVITTIVFASMAGYALARFHFPGRNVLFLIVLFVQMVPFQVIFLSNYLILKNLGLLNIWGLLLSGFVGAAAVFLMKQFFEGLPKELEEAASLDGAGPFTTFWRVMLPQAGPALGALTITTFQGAWNDFFWPLVVLKENSNLTLPIGLLSFRQFYGGGVGDYGLLLAGAVISAIPVIILFIVFQRYFVESSAGDAVKG